MKNIAPFGIMIFLCTVARANAASDFTNAPYLNDAANAWGQVLDNFGTSGAIAYQINRVKNTDTTKFQNFMSDIAYNDTALTLYETLQNTETGFRAISNPLQARRTQCAYNQMQCQHARRHIDVNASVLATYNQWNGNNNTDFKTRNSGAYIHADGYITDGFVLGIAYTRIDTKTRQTAVRANATTNSLTLFSKYLGDSGTFVNMGISGGNTNWQNDKSVAGVLDTSAYDTNYFAFQINSGVALERGLFTITPQLGARYTRLYTDKHIDAAAQEYHKWWYNMLTGYANIKLGYDFIGDWYVVRPTINAGLSYDFLSNGPEEITVRLLGDNMYQIPIDIPHRTAMDGGAGIEFISNNFNIAMNYNINLRSDYIAHTVMLDIKAMF